MYFLPGIIMRIQLKRYWFEFEFELEWDDPKIPPGTLMGCGVTAYNYEDTVDMLCRIVFDNKVLPKIKKIIEDVDITTLDKGHVIPNMLPPNWRGIWFPIGYNH